ncbi:nitrate/nitrite transporter [Fictibacillus enclensis]|uniref:nitrate/nitrite transporter n=1 Tax=Fictibacillus enclensis TaxID=1017270 RepID=UPI0024BF4681|nr:nitrate/nitrite transporter [Fictibacillus enclensis]WHY71189.1 MFS transporter [Fictibacillus enclensis]
MNRKIQLPLQTVNLIAGFMVWVLISSLLPFIKEDINIPADKLAWVTAVPVILGSLLRIPLGYLTNRFGARKLFIICFLILLFPVFYIAHASTYVDLLVGGLFLGVGGAVFSVGVTSVPKYYPKERHGFVNGIYGAGNIGTAVSTFAAPVLASKWGWTLTVQFYLVLLAIIVIANLFLGDRRETKERTKLSEQLKSIYKNEKLWLFCLFYFITFGSFVAFTIYLPNFLVSNFGLEKVDAGIRTAGFIVLATLMRPVGGWLADRFHSLKLLMFVFGGYTLSAMLLSFAPSIQLYTLGCLTIAFCAGMGNGVIFKLVPSYFPKQAGIVNGVVSAMGGLGGFFPPLILAVLFKLTGHYAIGFMALSEVALASLVLVIWMYYQDRLSMSAQVLNSTAEGIMITDKEGKIISVNPAFSELTGYAPEEVIGKNPNLLKSGLQDQNFYKNMWLSIEEKGYWQGEIWNRRKDGRNYLEWLTISAIKNEAGEINQFAGMFSDITHYKKKSM